METRRVERAELADAQRPHESRVAGRARTGACRDHNPGCFLSTPRPPRTGTTGLEPAASRLTSECSTQLSYAPKKNVSSAGGIRTHGLELMRLAGTASPLPRKSGRQESNLRSPVPETGGVARLPYSQMKAPPAGLEPALSGLRARRHLPFDHGGVSSGGRGRTCVSRLTAARLAVRLHRNERKERDSNPQGPEAHPFSRRDTAPVGSPSR